MAEIDDFASLLLEEAKRFLEKAAEASTSEEEEANLHAALMLAFCSLEAHTNAIADELVSTRVDLTVHERAYLIEAEVKLEDGSFVASGMKMNRLEDRIQFLHRRFGGQPLDKKVTWWADLQMAIKLRNQLTHPKAKPAILAEHVGRAIDAILACLDALYRAVYVRPFPSVGRGRDSRLTF